MRHRKQKKLGTGRDKDRRLMRLLASALILQEKINLSSKRGKLVRGVVERLITKSKDATLHEKRQLFSALPQNAARKVFEVLGPKYKERKGGYTRLLRVGKAKDGTLMVRIEFV